MNEDENQKVPQAQEEKTTKPKRKHKFLKGLAIFLIVLAAITLAAGFALPGLLWQKDLGVRYTTADYQSALQKLKYTKDETPTGELESDYQYTYGPVVDTDIKLTSEEITAFINTDRPSYFAVKNVQVRINDDGTIDATGAVNVDYVLNNILGGKYSRQDIVNKIPALGILPSTVNLAINFSGQIYNNISSGDINDVSVQGIPLPKDLVQAPDANDIVTSGLDKFIGGSNEKSGTNIEKIGVESGELVIKGQFPSSLIRTKK